MNSAGNGVVETLGFEKPLEDGLIVAVVASSPVIATLEVGLICSGATEGSERSEMSERLGFERLLEEGAFIIISVSSLVVVETGDIEGFLTIQ